jgi:hypothetical protein
MQTCFDLATWTGHTLQSPAKLGTVFLTRLPGPVAFIPLVATNILGIKQDRAVEGKIASEAARVTVIGAVPRLQPLLGTGS